MGSAKKRKDLFTASRLADFCQVDLKTIHNWAERGRIDHFRTPGRHLRFRRRDVLDFLRKYGYPIPDEVAPQRPSIGLMLEDATERRELRKVLESRFELVDFPDAVAGLLSVGREPPDAIVLSERVGPLGCGQVIGALRRSDNTRHVRAVVVTAEGVEPRAPRPALAGASAQVSLSNPDGLRDTLEALMGIGR